MTRRRRSAPIRERFQRMAGWIMVAISVAAVLLADRAAVAAGAGFAQAPPCITDVWRNHSLAEAAKAVGEVEALVAASGPGLVYPELGTAKNLMNVAWSRLEQIMNQGMLKWSKLCMSCDPTRGTPTGPSFLDVANGLVAVSRLVYDRPNYGEYLGLVDTPVSNMEVLDYCGAYATGLAGTPYLDEIDGCWEFGRVGGPILRLDLLLQQTGTQRGLSIGNRPHANETYYWPLGDEIVFLNADRSVTSILKRKGEFSYSGPYIAHPSMSLTGIDHYLKRRTWGLASTTVNRMGNPFQFDHLGSGRRTVIRELWNVQNNLLRLRYVPDVNEAPQLSGVAPDLQYALTGMAPRLVAGEVETLVQVRATAQGYDPNSTKMTAFQLTVAWGSNPPGTVAFGRWDPVAKVLRQAGRSTTLNKTLQMTPQPPFPLDAIPRCNIAEGATVTLTVDGGLRTRPGNISFHYEEE